MDNYIKQLVNESSHEYEKTELDEDYLISNLDNHMSRIFKNPNLIKLLKYQDKSYKTKNMKKLEIVQKAWTALITGIYQAAD